MHQTRSEPAHHRDHFSPWDAGRAGQSCRTCVHAIGLADGHHLYCRRGRIVPVYPCGSWERGAGVD